MHIYEGKNVEGLEFFDLLNQNDEFCSELGRVVLAAGKLESILIQALDQGGQSPDLKKTTLSRLITHAEGRLELKDLAPHLKLVKTQRNYLMSAPKRSVIRWA